MTKNTRQETLNDLGNNIAGLNLIMERMEQSGDDKREKENYEIISTVEAFLCKERLRLISDLRRNP